MSLWAAALALAAVSALVRVLFSPTSYTSALQNNAWYFAQGVTVMVVIYALLWYAALWFFRLLL